MREKVGSLCEEVVGVKSIIAFDEELGDLLIRIDRYYERVRSKNGLTCVQEEIYDQQIKSLGATISVLSQMTFRVRRTYRQMVRDKICEVGHLSDDDKVELRLALAEDLEPIVAIVEKIKEQLPINGFDVRKKPSRRIFSGKPDELSVEEPNVYSAGVLQKLFLEIKNSA